MRRVRSAMIEVHTVSKRFGDTVALHPTDLQVTGGERLAILGVSGSGKSTLLRAMLRLVVPDTGTVHVDGIELTETSAQAVRRATGYVIQGGGLFPHLTARDNVGLLPRSLGWSEPKLETRLTELADLTALNADIWDRTPGELSGGQRQRVALARALVMEPRLVLLDEPLGALDPLTRDGLQTDLVAIFDALETTVVLVTHDLREAAVLADRVAVMESGRIVQRGRLDVIADAPATPFVEAFINAQRYALP